MKRGVTLIECVLAAVILEFVSLALFEGVIIATRIAHEKAELLAAEAIAWDAVWKRFNEDFTKLEIGEVSETLDERAAWQLMPVTTGDGELLRASYAPPKLIVTVEKTDETGFAPEQSAMKKISADVEWGPPSRLRNLKSEGCAPCVYRGSLGRDS